MQVILDLSLNNERLEVGHFNTSDAASMLMALLYSIWLAAG